MALLNFFRSTIGLKIIMGLTGFAMFGFLIGHMLGNWQFFAGPDAINSYAAFLHRNHELLWAFRIGLLTTVVLHIWASVTLTMRNRKARGQGYETGAPPKASWASRTMMLSGIVVLAFIIFHILHFTTRDIFDYSGAEFTERTPTGDRFDVYKMMIAGFSKPWVAIFYMVSMAIVGFHLSHGIASAFRSLGLMNGAYRKIEEYGAAAFAAFIFVGMSSLPFLILIGVFPMNSESTTSGYARQDQQAQVESRPPSIMMRHGTER